MRRSVTRVRMAAVVLSLAMAPVAQAQPTSGGNDRGRPLDLPKLIRDSLAMRTVEISAESSPALSPDGRLLAYGVRTPVPDVLNLRPRLPGKREFALQRPLELVVLELATRKETRASPAGASGWQPVWAADGRSLVFYSDAGGGLRLWSYDRATGRSRAVSDARIAGGYKATSPAQWSPSGKEVYVAIEPPRPSPPSPGQPTVVVYGAGKEAAVGGDRAVRKVDAGFDQSPPGHLAAIDVASGATRIVLPANADPPPQRPLLSPSGHWLLYGAPPRNNVWLALGKTPPDSLADLSTDLGVVAATGGTASLLEADVDFGAAAWHPKQDMVAYVKAGRLWVVTLDEGPAPAQRRQLGQEIGSLQPGLFAFSRDGRLLFLGHRGAAGRMAIAVIPLDGTPGRLIAPQPPLSFQGLLSDARRELWQPDERFATALLADTQTRESTLWRIDLATGAGSELWRGPARPTVAEVSTGRPGVIARIEDPRSPPDLFWFSADFREKRRLTRLNPQLEDATVGPIEYFTTDVPAFDGTLLNVRTAVMRPPGAAHDGTARGIVCVYPGNDHSASAALFGGGERCGIPSYILAASGFAVVLPHLPKRARDTTGNVSQEYADALLPVVYRAGALGYVDTRRLALFGHSQGGYAATAILSETNLFRAAVSASSMAYDLIASWGYLSPGYSVPNLWPITGHRMSGPPWDDLKRYIQNSPYLQADKMTTPLLLVVGASDRFPHVEEAGKLFNALRTYQKTTQLAIYEGEEHFLFRGSRANTLDLWNRMLGFIDRYVPAAPDRRTSETGR
jgi:dipeptidyl aminopeptidase/acylaminoacyl peptidase